MLQYRKYLVSASSLLLIAMSLNSCKRNCSLEINQKLLGIFFEKTIEIPKEMELLSKHKFKNNLTIDGIIKQSKFTVIHFFTADCDKCVEGLKIIQSYLSKNIDTNVKYVFVASAPTKVYAEEAIVQINFQYPIFYEKEYYSYMTSNKFPVGDKAYENILLNQSGKIIALGSFYDNEKAKELFANTMSCY